MRILILLGILLCSFIARGNRDFVFIDSISIDGNQKTKEGVILRELLFSKGDTILIPRLSSVLKESEQLVMNTGLFQQVKINFISWQALNNKVHIQVAVEETWYIFPMPVFELADRNFNVWWVEQNRSMQRVNFGLEFTHLNFTGRKDKIKVKAKYGYTRNYAIGYSMPYINAAQTVGLSGDVSYSRNREINYITVDNKQAFFRDEDKFVYQRFSSRLGLDFRPGLRSFHSFSSTYYQNQISDKIAHDLNPNFFIQGKQLQRYFSIAYRYIHDTRDVRPYPMSGHKLELQLEKDGLGVFDDRNGLTFNGSFSQFLSFSPRWSMGVGLSGKLSLIRHQQPYNDNRAIGFGQNALHGYEYYIVDGLDMFIVKTATRFKIFDTELHFGNIVPIEAYRRMPVRAFLSLNNDVGYANDPFENEANFLSNRMLWGGGIGLDIVLFFDKVIKIEYSFNHLLENGLFLHLSLNI